MGFCLRKRFAEETNRTSESVRLLSTGVSWPNLLRPNSAVRLTQPIRGFGSSLRMFLIPCQWQHLMKSHPCFCCFKRFFRAHIDSGTFSIIELQGYYNVAFAFMYCDSVNPLWDLEGIFRLLICVLTEKNIYFTSSNFSQRGFHSLFSSWKLRTCCRIIMIIIKTTSF